MNYFVMEASQKMNERFKYVSERFMKHTKFFTIEGLNEDGIVYCFHNPKGEVLKEIYWALGDKPLYFGGVGDGGSHMTIKEAREKGISWDNIWASANKRRDAEKWKKFTIGDRLVLFY